MTTVLATSTIRVALAEDNALVRRGVTALVGEHDDLELVATVDRYESLLAAVARDRPDVVITDIRMPPTGTDEGVRAALALRESNPGTGVVVLSQYCEPAYVRAVFAGGSRGRAYLLKDRVGHGDQLVEAVRAVAAGGSFVDPVVLDVLVEVHRHEAHSPIARLTAREREILAQISTGRNNAAIADQLVISERAVAKHINSIFAKLDLGGEDHVHRRVKAVLLFLASR
jgi:DNA-binding NarL/FixJ family response regulator